MTPEEKICQLAEICVAVIDSLLSVVPYNHRDYLEHLRGLAEQLANED